MVFWSIYPLYNLIQSKFNRSIFKSQIFNKNPIKLPDELYSIIINKNNNIDLLPQIRQFLKENFKSNKMSPILDIPEENLLDLNNNNNNNEFIIALKDINKQIIGCIRCHYLGIFISNLNEPIYCIDCFCINKKWRKKGLGDYLLTKLHTYGSENNMFYATFLKEGPILNIMHMPFYSSIYVFRKLDRNKINNQIQKNNCKSLNISDAYKLTDLFLEFNTIFIIRNINTKNQIWKLYQKDTYKVLICFQDTYQRLEEDGQIKKIGWVTAWIESPNMIDKYREEASLELSNMVNSEFDYIWINKEWTGKSTEWKIDGPFHWYLYQWTSSITINKSYCILN